MSPRRSAINNDGYSLAEVLVTLALIAMGVGIVVGIKLLSSKKQSALIYTARQLAADVHRAVQQAQSRSAELSLEVNDSNYRIYKENGTSPAGYQTEDELILQKDLTEGVAIVESGHPPLPAAWGDPSNPTDVEPLGSGNTLKFTGRGLNQEAAVVFFLSGARSYSYVCVHLFSSGDTEIVRSSGSGWMEAPPGS